jgi:tetratricopeptide (TPR) repeat protein
MASSGPSKASLSIVLALAACVGAPTLATAQEADGGVERARARFGEAVDLADQGRYDEALTIFEEIQLDRPHPVVLYNIAWCQSRLGRTDEAVATFDAYLEAGDTDGERQVAARAERGRLVSSITPLPEEPETAAPEVAAQEPDAAAEDAPRRSRRRLHRAWFWTFFGLSLATGAAAAATGVTTMVLRDRWIEEADQGARDAGLTLRTVTDVLLYTMAAEAIATLVLGLFTDFGRSPATPEPGAATD